MIRIRWRAVFEPICWLLSHRWQDVQAISVWTKSGESCKRCLRWVDWWRFRGYCCAHGVEEHHMNEPRFEGCWCGCKVVGRAWDDREVSAS